MSERGERYIIEVSELEFVEGGNTVWVHSSKGATVLRIKCLRGDIKVNQNCSNIVPHFDVVVKGDIEICMPKV